MVHHPLMTPPQRLPASLTPLDAALATLLDGLEPVTAVELPLAQALRCIAAAMPPLNAVPSRDIAVADGFAFRAEILVGASSYSPLPLTEAPAWVEAGDAMPDECDCVLDADAVDASGPLVQVLAEGVAVDAQGSIYVGETVVGHLGDTITGHAVKKLVKRSAATSLPGNGPRDR